MNNFLRNFVFFARYWKSFETYRFQSLLLFDLSLVYEADTSSDNTSAPCLFSRSFLVSVWISLALPININLIFPDAVAIVIWPSQPEATAETSSIDRSILRPNSASAYTRLSVTTILYKKHYVTRWQLAPKGKNILYFIKERWTMKQKLSRLRVVV